MTGELNVVSRCFDPDLFSWTIRGESLEDVKGAISRIENDPFVSDSLFLEPKSSDGQWRAIGITALRSMQS